MSYMQQMDNTSVYSSENDHNAVNNNPSYNTVNQFYANTKCPYTTGPGQAVIKPVYIVPNEQGTEETMFVQNFLPMTGSSNYYTISTGYPFPPLSYAPQPLETKSSLSGPSATEEPEQS